MKTVSPPVKSNIISITCDRCEKIYKSPDDNMEIQEFLSFSDIGGYRNVVFGDGTQWSIDLCQHCVKEVLGKWVKIHGNIISEIKEFRESVKKDLDS